MPSGALDPFRPALLDPMKLSLVCFLLMPAGEWHLHQVRLHLTSEHAQAVWKSHLQVTHSHGLSCMEL
jgi:hypothetical protein